MSELRSALPDARHDGLVTVTEAGLQGMITLKGDLTSEALKATVGDVASAAFPDQRKVNIDGETGVAWMAPDELLVLVPRSETGAALDRLANALKDEHYLAADVSDARALFTIEGAAIRDMLAKLTPADLSLEALAPGEIRRTRFAQVAAAFWFDTETRARLICFRSVAPYVFGLLSTAADPAAPVDHFAG